MICQASSKLVTGSEVHKTHCRGSTPLGGSTSQVDLPTSFGQFRDELSRVFERLIPFERGQLSICSELAPLPTGEFFEVSQSLRIRFPSIVRTTTKTMTTSRWLRGFETETIATYKPGHLPRAVFDPKRCG